MPPTKQGRCCQSTPRCKSCPVWRVADVLALRGVGSPGELPAHLIGVPACLHKYEPLFRPAVDGGAAQADGRSAEAA